jgi:parallel beta-helix repeat protein
MLELSPIPFVTSNFIPSISVGIGTSLFGTPGVNGWKPFIPRPLSADHIALKTAIASTPEGGVLKLSRGYTLDGNIDIGKSITIDGSGYQISYSGLGAAFTILKDNTQIRNLWIDYDSGAGQSAIGSSPEYLESGIGITVSGLADNVIIENSTFTGRFQAAIGVYSPGVDQLTIRNNEFQDGYYGFLIDNTGYNTGLTIAGNRFHDMKGDPICINNPVYVHEKNFTNGWGRYQTRDRNLVTMNFSITDNQIFQTYAASQDVGLGISVAGAKYGLIARNYINGSNNSGIHLEDDTAWITISDNQIFDTRGYEPGRNDWIGWKGSSGAIWLHNSDNIQILNNTIQDSIDSGIFLTLKTGDTRNENIIISGNVISNAGDSIRATGWNVLISGNELDTPVKRYAYSEPFDWIRVFDF